MKVVYLLITAAAAVFYLLYKGDLSFVLLAFLLVMPALLFIMLIIGAALLEVDVSCDRSAVEKGGTAAVKITVRNRFIMPMALFSAKVRCGVSAPFEDGGRKVCRTSVPLGGRASETISVTIAPEHCGTVSVTVKSVRFTDMMGLTELRKKVNFRAEITVLPRVFPITAGMDEGAVYDAESGVFSKEKPGDDPSEIFMLREYREGDRHNLVHWKLSGRSGTLIVRELSRPISGRVLIIADFGGCTGADAADDILETAAAVSAFLAENGTAHIFGVPCRGGEPRTGMIADMDGFYSEMAGIVRENGGIDFEDGAAYSGVRFEGYSRVIAVSERCGAAYTDELAALCGQARLTVICVSKSAGEREKPGETEIIFADAEKLASSGDLFI